MCILSFFGSVFVIKMGVKKEEPYLMIKIASDYTKVDSSFWRISSAASGMTVPGPKTAAAPFSKRKG
jgi:hypothetical protein